MILSLLIYLVLTYLVLIVLVIFVFLMIFIIVGPIFRLIGIIRLSQIKKQKVNGVNESAIIICENKRGNIFKKTLHYFIDKLDLTVGIKDILEYFKKLNKPFTVYININVDQFEDIMLDKNITEVYIFSHGSKYGVSLGSVYYEYKNLLSKNINLKEYIAQLHCNHIPKKKKYNKGISLSKFSKYSYITTYKMSYKDSKYYSKMICKGIKLCTIDV